MNIYIVYMLLAILLPIVALLYDGIERKMTARIQGRVGPPITQSWLDFLKLLTKQVKLPDSTNITMLISGLVLMFGGALIPLVMVFLRKGDLLLLMYLMVGGTLGILLVGMSFRSPYSRVGVSRELQMAFGYEIAFIFAIVLTIMITGYRTVDGYLASMPPLLTWPLLVIPLLLFVFVVPAKVGVVPVDIAEAESEIAEGPFVEIGGKYLAIAKLTRSMKMLAIVQFISVLFFIPSYVSGWLYWTISLLLDALLIFFLVSVVRNSASRIKIDQAVKFYTTVVLCMATIGFLIVYIVRGWGV